MRLGNWRRVRRVATLLAARLAAPLLHCVPIDLREIAAVTGAPKSTVHDVLSEIGRAASKTGQKEPPSKRDTIRSERSDWYSRGSVTAPLQRVDNLNLAEGKRFSSQGVPSIWK